jgi:hypothetical protein
MSEKKLNIYQKLNNFNTMVGAIRKDNTNPHYHYKYADINNVLEAIREPLSTNGLVALQTTIRKDDIFCLNTKIINIDSPEEFVEIDIPLIYNGDMQKLGSAITYARRYGLVTLLGLEQEDDDGNLASGKTQQQTQQTQQTLHGIRQAFADALFKAGLTKNDLVDFTNYMDNMGYDLKDDKVKQNILNQVPKFVKEYLEMKASVNENQ